MAAIAASLIDQWADPRWRLNNLYFIINAEGQRVQFRLNWAQERLFDDMHYLNVILKARQLGFTTFIDLYMLDQCVFNSNIRAGVIAHTREDAEAFFRDKVKYPYDNLPEQIQAANPAVQDSARQLSFANNSSIRVGTSLRSGTLQYLHVSEYGKVCAKFPEKATEIRTGAFNTVHPGQVIWVESTAEGQDGDFFQMCQRAQSMQRMGSRLTELDFKFHFFPWWKHPGYALSDDVVISKEMHTYFTALRNNHGIGLTHQQMCWYSKKAEQQGSYMKREYPSTPEEAFEAAIEGAYYGHEMARTELDGRICDLPTERGIAVETWWDLGMNDVMSIGFVQRVGGWIHFLDYYENSGHGLAHYATELQDRQRANGWVYGEHFWPHDGNTRIMDETGRKRIDVMRGLGYEPRIVERAASINDGIEGVRGMIPKMRFHRANCERLVLALKNYRKEWDEDTATFRNKPLHNWASHPADMVRTGVKAEPRGKPARLTYPQNHPSRGVV